MGRLFWMNQLAQINPRQDTHREGFEIIVLLSLKMEKGTLSKGKQANLGDTVNSVPDHLGFTCITSAHIPLVKSCSTATVQWSKELFYCRKALASTTNTGL